MDNEFKNAISPFTKDTVIYEATDSDTLYLGFIEGLAATNFKDRYGDIISDQALKNGAKDLLKHTTVFKDHNYNVDSAVGTVLESKFVKSGDMSGIHVKVGISKTATDLWMKVKEDIVKAFSIGGIWKAVSKSDDDNDEDDDTFYIDDMELWEVSVVGMPANPTALFGYLCMKHLESVKKDYTPKVSKVKEEIKIEEQIQMTNEPEWKKDIEEMEQKILAAIAASKAEPEPIKEPDNEAITEVTKLVGNLAETITPLLEEQKQKKELAERKSLLIKEEEERISNLPYGKQLRLQMFDVISTIRDSSVEVTELLGDLEYIPPIHHRDIDVLRAEKIRIGAL